MSQENQQNNAQQNVQQQENIATATVAYAEGAVTQQVDSVYSEAPVQAVQAEQIAMQAVVNTDQMVADQIYAGLSAMQALQVAEQEATAAVVATQ